MLRVGVRAVLTPGARAMKKFATSDVCKPTRLAGDRTATVHPVSLLSGETSLRGGDEYRPSVLPRDAIMVIRVILGAGCAQNEI
jgi:hypothetical protein